MFKSLQNTVRPQDRSGKQWLTTGYSPLSVCSGEVTLGFPLFYVKAIRYSTWDFSTIKAALNYTDLL